MTIIRSAAAAATVAAALLAAPLTATAASAATSCPAGFRTAGDSLAITQTVAQGTIHYHWTGSWCASATRQTVKSVHTHFDGDYTVTDKAGKTVTGRVVRVRSTNTHGKHGIVLNRSELGLEIPMTATDGSTTYTTVRAGDPIVIGLSPKGWFVAANGSKLPTTLTLG